MSFTALVSIPQGTIKSLQHGHKFTNLNYVSIPQGTIKRAIHKYEEEDKREFQFHKVRLKDYILRIQGTHQ